jgi:hypothetical protein
MAIAFFENQGRSGLTLGFSSVSILRGRARGNLGVLTSDGYTGRIGFLPDERGEMRNVSR